MATLTPFSTSAIRITSAPVTPILKPELSHGIELGYNRSFDSGANISVGSFYRHNIDDIQQFTTRYDSLNINGREYPNVIVKPAQQHWHANYYWCNLFASVPLTKKLNLRTNMFFASRTNTNPGISKVTGLAYRINLNASYQFGNDLTAEAFANYNSSQKNLQGTRPYFFFYNLAIRKQFMNKKASLGLQAANPFTHYVTQRATTFGTGFNQVSIRQVPLQSFGITLSYKFGKLEFSKRKKKTGKITTCLPRTRAGDKQVNHLCSGLFGLFAPMSNANKPENFLVLPLNLPLV
jgi:ferric enterobactin receptor